MQRDINFFSVYRSSVESDNGVDIISVIGLSLIGAILIGFAGTYSYLKINDTSDKTHVQSITDYLQSADVKKSEDMWNTFVIKSKALKSYEDKANDEVTAFNTLPVLDSGLLANIAKAMPSDVIILSFSYSGSALVLTCTSADKLSPANFVNSLKTTDRINSVTYDKVTQISDTEYDFAVTCGINGGDGK
jgi:hypothetical protein